MNMIKNTIKQYSLVILGLIVLLIFFWIRYIRERIPKDIPFNLSLLSLSILICTCTIFVLIIKRILKPKPPVLFLLILKYLRIILIPVNILDNLIRNTNLVKQLSQTSSYYLHSIIIFKRTRYLFILYIIFHYVPRFCLLILFIFDVFYFRKIEHMYLFMILGIIPLIFQYIIYILRQLHKEYYAYIMNNFYIYFVPTNKKQQEDWEEAEGICYSMASLHEEFDTLTHNLEEFLAYRVTNKWETFDYRACLQGSENIKTSLEKKIDKLEKFYFRMPIVINLEDFLFSYDFMLEYYTTDTDYDKLIGNQKYHPMVISNLLLYVLYLICWLYILIISIPSLHITDMEWILIERFQDYNDPFTNLPISMTIPFLMIVNQETYDSLQKSSPEFKPEEDYYLLEDTASVIDLENIMKRFIKRLPADILYVTTFIALHCGEYLLGSISHKAFFECLSKINCPLYIFSIACYGGVYLHPHIDILPPKSILCSFTDTSHVSSLRHIFYQYILTMLQGATFMMKMICYITVYYRGNIVIYISTPANNNNPYIFTPSLQDELSFIYQLCAVEHFAKNHPVILQDFYTYISKRKKGLSIKQIEELLIVYCIIFNTSHMLAKSVKPFGFEYKYKDGYNGDGIHELIRNGYSLLREMYTQQSCLPDHIVNNLRLIHSLLCSICPYQPKNISIDIGSSIIELSPEPFIQDTTIDFPVISKIICALRLDLNSTLKRLPFLLDKPDYLFNNISRLLSIEYYIETSLLKKKIPKNWITKQQKILKDILSTTIVSKQKTNDSLADKTFAKKNLKSVKLKTTQKSNTSSNLTKIKPTKKSTITKPKRRKEQKAINELKKRIPKHNIKCQKLARKWFNDWKTKQGAEAREEEYDKMESIAEKTNSKAFEMYKKLVDDEKKKYI